MAVLQNKIDFALVIAVNHANPNGDPLNGNRPRETYEGLGEISDVCLKRKIRSRMRDLGQNVFVQSDDRCNDGFKSLKDRADGCPAVKKAEKDKKVSQVDELETLKRKLNVAIQEERYEDAAKIRDKIKDIEKKNAK